MGIRKIIETRRKEGEEFREKFTSSSKSSSNPFSNPFIVLSLIREEDGPTFVKHNLDYLKQDEEENRVSKTHTMRVSYEGIGEVAGPKALFKPILETVGLKWEERLKPLLLEDIVGVINLLGTLGYAWRYFIGGFIALPLLAVLFSDKSKTDFLSAFINVGYYIIMILIPIAILFLLFRKKKGLLYRFRCILIYYLGRYKKPHDLKKPFFCFRPFYALYSHLVHRSKEDLYQDIVEEFQLGVGRIYPGYITKNSLGSFMGRRKRGDRKLIYEIKGAEQLASWQCREIQEFFRDVQKRVPDLVVLVYLDRRKMDEKRRRVEDIPFENRYVIALENIGDSTIEKGKEEWRRIVGCILDGDEGENKWKKWYRQTGKKEEIPLYYIWRRTFGNPDLIEQAFYALFDRPEKYGENWDDKVLRSRCHEYKFQREWARLKPAKWIDDVERLGMIEGIFREEKIGGKDSFKREDLVNSQWRLYHHLFKFESPDKAMEFLRELQQEMVLEDIEDIRFFQPDLDYLDEPENRMGDLSKNDQYKEIAECFLQKEIKNWMYKEIATKFYKNAGELLLAAKSRIEEVRMKYESQFSSANLIDLLEEALTWCRESGTHSDALETRQEIHFWKTKIIEGGVFEGRLVYLFHYRRIWDEDSEGYLGRIEEEFLEARNKEDADTLNFQMALIQAYFLRLKGDYPEALEKTLEAAQTLVKIQPDHSKRPEFEVALDLVRGFILFKRGKSDIQQGILALETAKKHLGNILEERKRKELGALIEIYLGYYKEKTGDEHGAESHIKKALADIQDLQSPVEFEARRYLTRFYRKSFKKRELEGQLSLLKKQALPLEFQAEIALTEAVHLEQSGKLQKARELYQKAISLFEQGDFPDRACRGRVYLLLLLDLENNIDHAISTAFYGLEQIQRRKPASFWCSAFHILLSWFYFKRAENLNKLEKEELPDSEGIWIRIHRELGQYRPVPTGLDRPCWRYAVQSELPNLREALHKISLDHLKGVDSQSFGDFPKTLRPLYPLLKLLHSAPALPSLWRELSSVSEENDLYYGTRFLHYLTRFSMNLAKSDSAFLQRTKDNLKKLSEKAKTLFPHLVDSANALIEEANRELLKDEPYPLIPSFRIEEKDDGPELLEEDGGQDGISDSEPPAGQRVFDKWRQRLEQRRKNPLPDMDLFPYHLLFAFDTIYENQGLKGRAHQFQLLSFVEDLPSSPDLPCEVMGRRVRIFLDEMEWKELSKEISLKEDASHPVGGALKAIGDFYLSRGNPDLKDVRRIIDSLFTLPLSPLFYDFLTSHLLRILSACGEVPKDLNLKVKELKQSFFIIPKKRWKISALLPKFLRKPPKEKKKFTKLGNLFAKMSHAREELEKGNYGESMDVSEKVLDSLESSFPHLLFHALEIRLFREEARLFLIDEWKGVSLSKMENYPLLLSNHYFLCRHHKIGSTEMLYKDREGSLSLLQNALEITKGWSECHKILDQMVWQEYLLFGSAVKSREAFQSLWKDAELPPSSKIKQKILKALWGEGEPVSLPELEKPWGIIWQALSLIPQIRKDLFPAKCLKQMNLSKQNPSTLYPYIALSILSMEYRKKDWEGFKNALGKYHLFKDRLREIPEIIQKRIKGE